MRQPLVWSSRRNAAVGYQTVPLKWAERPTIPAMPPNAIATRYGSQVVTAQRVLIVPAQDTRKAVTLRNHGGNTVFIGDATVTYLSGQPLRSGDDIRRTTTDAMYGVCYGGSERAEVRWNGEYD
jgi:hypothetical protein